MGLHQSQQVQRLRLRLLGEAPAEVEVAAHARHEALEAQGIPHRQGALDLSAQDVAPGRRLARGSQVALQEARQGQELQTVGYTAARAELLAKSDLALAVLD